jgi:hypothetical protein
MSETIVAPVGGEAPVAAVAPIVDDGASELSIEQAVQLRRQREQEEPAPVEKVEKTAPVEQDELPDEGNAAPEEDPGENAETEPEEHLPPVERPRSWSKDDDDDWNALPRARQEKIAANERAREADINQRINKAAEAAKAAEAKAAEAEQAKQQYFSKLPSMDDLQRIVGNGPFADIKNQDDVTALLKNDPFRYLEWKDYQDKLGGIAAEVQKANQTKAQEKQSKRAAYEAEQSKLLIELVPDMAAFGAIGNREDLSDQIYRIDPTETPFFSAIEKVKASATNHEWQTQALAAASTSNAQLEGDDNYNADARPRPLVSATSARSRARPRASPAPSAPLTTPAVATKWTTRRCSRALSFAATWSRS